MSQHPSTGPTLKKTLEWLGENRLIACWQFKELPGRHFHLCLPRFLRWLGPVIRPLLYGALFTEEGESEPH